MNKKINSFLNNRTVKYFTNEFFTSLSLFGLPMFYTILIIFLFVIKPSLGVKLLITLISVEIIGIIIKLLYHKKRPKARSTKNLIEKIDAGSFPSIHTARITTIAIILNSAISNVILLIVSILLVMGVATSRIYLKHHYLNDVIGGFVISSIISSIILLIQIL